MSPQQSTPTFTIVTRVDAARRDLLRQCIASVQRQTRRDWELLLVADGEPPPAIRKTMRRAGRDRRVRLVLLPTPSGPARAWNAAINAARGQWLGLLEQHDVLLPGALARIAAEAQQDPGATVIYSDCAQIDGKGTVVGTFKKPDWSPERLRGHSYLGALAMLNIEAVRRAGGFRPQAGPAAEHDLLLRLTETGGRVRHVPEVLYQSRSGSGVQGEDGRTQLAADQAGARAVQEHCDRLGLPARVKPTGFPGYYRLDRTPSRGHRVSVIIPTRGTPAEVFGRRRVMVVEAVHSMLQKSPDTEFEVVVVADDPLNAPYLQDLRTLLGNRLLVVPYDKPFNFSEKVNLGAIHASGDILIFANDDLELISWRWVEQLTALAEQPDVGLVGALLWFEDGTVQHAGHVYHRGEATHAHFGRRTRTGYFGDAVIDHEVSGATAALVACRREVWEAVGGFTLHLPGNFNDVDFCIKITQLGYRIVVAPSVLAWHFESKTRNPTVNSEEAHFLRRRWGAAIHEERFVRSGT